MLWHKAQGAGGVGVGVAYDISNPIFVNDFSYSAQTSK